MVSGIKQNHRKGYWTFTHIHFDITLFLTSQIGGNVEHRPYTSLVVARIMHLYDFSTNLLCAKIPYSSISNFTDQSHTPSPVSWCLIDWYSISPPSVWSWKGSRLGEERLDLHGRIDNIKIIISGEIPSTTLIMRPFLIYVVLVVLLRFFHGESLWCGA